MIKKILFIIACPLLVTSCAKNTSDDATFSPDNEAVSDAAGVEPAVALDQQAEDIFEDKLPDTAAVEETPALEPAAIDMTASVTPPTVVEIQQALKNAGLYQGEVDGKPGPQTQKAIIEFQATQGLAADGKVGPLTWDKLKSHLE